MSDQTIYADEIDLTAGAWCERRSRYRAAVVDRPVRFTAWQGEKPLERGDYLLVEVFKDGTFGHPFGVEAKDFSKRYQLSRFAPLMEYLPVDEFRKMLGQHQGFKEAPCEAAEFGTDPILTSADDEEVS